MDIFNADLHIHSPHSIAVSKSLNFDNMIHTCKKKGLNILGTGDILQPKWLKYAESNLTKEPNGAFSYKGINFILQAEIEDRESVHEVVLFPDFSSVREVQEKLAPHSKNILDEWGGRARVNLSPSELVDIVTDAGALVGPAHAFTPFKSIFRQNKFQTLEACYQDAFKKVSFLELGLSANTNLADRLDCLKNITFLSNSDAHSEGPRALGREFNKLDLDNPTFEEIQLALVRKGGRKVTLNVGLHPKLGKYYNMFCNKCRRRIIFEKLKNQSEIVLNQFFITEDFITYRANNYEKAKIEYINQVSKNKMTCPACNEELNKKVKIKLGVRERIEIISQHKVPKHPDHRPPYINAIPLVDIIRSVKNIKSTNSKIVSKIYDTMIEKLGDEFSILVDIPIDEIKKKEEHVAEIIRAFRNDEIQYTPGGGGTYGEIKLEV